MAASTCHFILVFSNLHFFLIYIFNFHPNSLEFKDFSLTLKMSAPVTVNVEYWWVLYFYWNLPSSFIEILIKIIFKVVPEVTPLATASSARWFLQRCRERSLMGVLEDDHPLKSPLTISKFLANWKWEAFQNLKKYFEA